MKNPLVENIKVERMSQKSLSIYSPFESQASTPLNRNRSYSSHTFLSKNMFAVNNVELIGKLKQIKNDNHKYIDKKSPQYVQKVQNELESLKLEIQKERHFYQKQIIQLKQNIRMKDELLDECQKQVYHIKATYNMINKLYKTDIEQVNYNYEKSVKSSRSIHVVQTVQTQIIQQPQQQEEDSFLQTKSKVLESFKNYQTDVADNNQQRFFQSKKKKYDSIEQKSSKKKDSVKNKQNLTQCFKKKKNQIINSTALSTTNLNIQLTNDQKQRLVSPIHRLIKRNR